MEKVREELIKLIEELAVHIIMIEPDDIIGLGEILRRIEEIQKVCSQDQVRFLDNLIIIIKKILEKVILNECSDPKQGITLIADGIRLIQDKVSNNITESPNNEEKFIKNASSWLGEDIEGSPSKELFSMDKDLEIYQDFISEALEYLGTIELNIINLEQSPGDKECINNIFRPFHTIKGVSGFLNLPEIHKLSHAMENLLDQARNGDLKINQEIIDFILESVDLLKRMVYDIKQQLDSGNTVFKHFDIQPYLDKIELIKNRKDWNKEQDSKELYDFSILNENETVIPPLGEILNSKGIVEKEDIIKALERQKNDCKNLKIGEILISENKAKPKEVIQALREQRQILSQKFDSTIRVDIKKLDNLVDMVGELVIALSLVQQNPLISNTKDQKLIQDFSHLKRITNELQKISMSLRMVPIKQTFQKMIRLVRDQAKKSGKMVELLLSGEETEIDRNMVDSLYEPLVHMIRNSIDHGIESPERRRSSGKEEVGKIYLRAYQQGGNVVIEIEDDGEGLNRGKILRRAKQKGLILDESDISDNHIYSFIFEPGFSTADKVTDVSGRGVGMDVVKKAVDRLKGKIDVFSEEGKGTRFVIRIPLTLAIMDGIVVRIGEERFIIPTEFVKEAIRPRREDIFTVHNKGDVIKVRNRLLPLLKPVQLIGISSYKENPWETLVLVIECDGNQNGLIIDDLLGKQEVVIKNMGERLKDVKGIAGATIMGDGRVGLILDVHNIFKMQRGNSNHHGFSNFTEIN